MIRSARLLALLVLALAAFTAIAAGRPLAPRTLGPTAWLTSNPKSAYAGGRFLTVWHQRMGALGVVVKGAFSDAGGSRLSPSAFALDIGTVRDEGSYHLLADGDSFLLLWRDAQGMMNVADVDLEGRVTDRRTFFLPDHPQATFAWNGTHFLGIVGTHDTRIVMFDREGRIVLPPSPLRTYSDASDIVVVGDRFIVLTSGPDALVAQEVTAAGAGEQTFVDFSRGSALAGYRPRGVVAVPIGNNELLVVWGTSSIDLGQLKSAIIRADGTRTAETLLASGNGEVMPLELLPAGGGYVAVFAADGAIHRVRINAAGGREGQPEVVASFSAPQIHAAAGAGTILVSFTPYEAGWPQVRTIAVPAAGPAGAPELLSIELSRQAQPILGAGRGDVFATWTEHTGDTVTVRGTAVDADGNPRTPVDLAPAVLASTETAWNGVHHLVVHRTVERIVATRVTADGMVVDDTPLVLLELPEEHYRADAGVVWTGSRWIVVASDGLRLHSIALSAEGEVLQRRVFDVRPEFEGEFRVAARPTLAFDGRRVLLAWLEVGECGFFPCIPGPTRTYATRLTRSGAQYDRLPIEIDVAEEENLEPSLSAASSGSEFLVLIDEEARVLDEAGGELRVVASRELFGWPAKSDVTWDGTSYAVALRYGAAAWYLGVLRLDRAGNDAAMRRATSTLTPYEQAAPSIAAPFAGNALIGVEEGTIADGVSATVYREHDLAPMPAPPSPPRNVHVRSLSTSVYEAAWDAPAEGEPGSYVIEQLWFDQWRVVAVVPAGVRHARVNPFFGDLTIRVRAFNAGGLSAPAEEGGGVPKRRAVR